MMLYFALYILAGLVVTTIWFRQTDPSVIEFILTGEYTHSEDEDDELGDGVMVFLILLAYLLWPLIILCYAFYYIVIWFLWDKVSVKGLRGVIKFILDTIPEFEFKVKKSESEEKKNDESKSDKKK